MPEAVAQAQTALARRALPVELAVASREALCGRYGAEHAPAFYLFRPDQHVAARWRGFVAGDVEAALAHACGNRANSEWRIANSE